VVANEAPPFFPAVAQRIVLSEDPLSVGGTLQLNQKVARHQAMYEHISMPFCFCFSYQLQSTAPRSAFELSASLNVIFSFASPFFLPGYVFNIAVTGAERWPNMLAPVLGSCSLYSQVGS
jgi:hypothetical protein